MSSIEFCLEQQQVMVLSPHLQSISQNRVQEIRDVRGFISKRNVWGKYSGQREGRRNRPGGKTAVFSSMLPGTHVGIKNEKGVGMRHHCYMQHKRIIILNK